MKILILGSGLVGPAAAFHAMSDPEVARVGVCDASQRQLDACLSQLAGRRGADKLTPLLLDLNDRKAAVEALSGFDAVVGALPPPVSPLAIRAALQAGTPLVDLSLPDYDQLPELGRAAENAGGCVILGCGLEPGLTEIMARHLAEKLDRVDELHIRCGGIPAQPSPPLGYKILFGGQQLPLTQKDAFVVENGQLKAVPRYSGVEPAVFPAVGECEAWHEGFMPWLLEIPALTNLRLGTQKTVRWPGYAAKVTVLKEMGLLSQQPLMVDGAQVVPKKLLDTLLYPYVRLLEGERDITVFRVEAIGETGGQRRQYKAEMVDRYDEASGFTSMARTTSFTGASVARMLARGDLRFTGARHPEQVISGPLFDKLVAELAAAGIRFDITSTQPSIES